MSNMSVQLNFFHFEAALNEMKNCVSQHFKDSQAPNLQGFSGIRQLHFLLIYF